MPSHCPRVRLRITEVPLDHGRLPGEGWLEQVRSDIEALESLGAEHVVLDTFYGDPGATRHHERAWAMLATLAESVVDLRSAGGCAEVTGMWQRAVRDDATQRQREETP